MKSSKKALTIACLATLYLVWGSTYLAQRVAVATFPPVRMASVRFLLAGALLFAILRATGAPKPSRREWLAATWSGFPMMVVGMGCAAIALRHAPSGLASLVFGSVPLWTAVFDRLSGGRSRRLEVLGLAIGFLGVALVASRGALRSEPTSALLLVGAAASYALGCVLTRRAPLAKGVMGTATQMLVGGASLFVWSVLRGEAFALPDAHAALAIAYLVVFGSLTGYTALGWLLKNARPVLATSYAYVNPIVALAIGAVFGGEHFAPADFIGLALVLVAVTLVALAGRFDRADPPRLLAKPIELY